MYAIRSNLKQEAAELVTTTCVCHPLRVLFVRFNTATKPGESYMFSVYAGLLCGVHQRRKLVPMLFADDDPRGKAQRKNAVEFAKLKAKKKARTRYNEEDKRAIPLAV